MCVCALAHVLHASVHMHSSSTKWIVFTLMYAVAAEGLRLKRNKIARGTRGQTGRRGRGADLRLCAIDVRWQIVYVRACMCVLFDVRNDIHFKS